ncbi:lysosomal enzyme receptor protein [Andrena cerasifolii]|uniref:lysosomal enzyme receptor protein n=1 Tax=Andrena cerasifolii TaxID=2819439 RepID=UPI0040376069
MLKSNILAFLYCFTTVAVLADTSVVNEKSFCVIQEPSLHLFSYNFTTLVDPAQDITLNHDYPNETLRVRLCAPLKQKCNGKDGYGICLIRNKEEKGIGKIPPIVSAKSGRIMFTFTGDDCTPGVKYKVTILMKCDYEAGNNSSPRLFPHTPEQCNLFMIWKSALACGPRTVQNCTATNNGLHYDLSPLRSSSQNYVIYTGDKTPPMIILNVCHSVIFEYDALCQMRSGACLQNSSGNKYINLGDVRKPPFFEDGKLKLEYEDGDVCKMRNITVPHIRTTISFICDFDAVDTIPEYIKGSEECHYQLIWKTTAACSIESLRNHSAITAGKCTVTNPLTNFTYNLQLLMNNSFLTTAQNGIEYKFGVCTAPAKTACVSGTGVCLTKNGTSIGMVNTNLTWQEGGPYLNYTGGDLCEDGRRRYTIIAFVCGVEGSSEKPLVMEQSPCQLIIHWNTNLVCEKRIKCATVDDEVNLTSLIKSTSNYIIKVNKTEFHINICRPLISVPSLTCAHGSAVCKAALNSNNQYVDEISLGFPEESPMLDKTYGAVLPYVGGSPCPENPRKLISSIFTFPCRYDDKGFPEFKEYKDCTYNFEWKTSLTCGAVMGKLSSPCIIKDQLLSHECDLSLLYTSAQIYHVKNKQGKEYAISICGGQKLCNGSAICQGSNGYGSSVNVVFDYGRDVIKLRYSNGGKCVNNASDSYSSEVRFICNESIGIGEPKLLWEWQCSAEFEWHTNVTCGCKSSPSQPTASTYVHEDVQDTSSSHTGTVAGAIVSVIALVAALLYFRDPDKRTCLRSCFNPFSSRRGSGRVQYCRVDTTEEARLLLDVDPTQCQTDSDDDLLNA